MLLRWGAGALAAAPPPPAPLKVPNFRAERSVVLARVLRESCAFKSLTGGWGGVSDVGGVWGGTDPPQAVEGDVCGWKAGSSWAAH